MSNSLAKEKALAIMKSGENDSLARLEIIANEWPNDVEIQFLYASDLAQKQEFNDSLLVFKKTVALDNSYIIARFQLCLLALSTDNIHTFKDYIPPLLGLDKNHYLQKFSQALTFIIDNQWSTAISFIHAGIKLNEENSPLNQDMLLLSQRLSDEPTTETTTQQHAPLTMKREEEQVNITNSNSVLLDIYKKK